MRRDLHRRLDRIEAAYNGKDAPHMGHGLASLLQWAKDNKRPRVKLGSAPIRHAQVGRQAHQHSVYRIPLNAL